MLQKIVRLQQHGGCFPDCAADIEWYFDNFDLDRASRGEFEPHRGVDQMFDDACDAEERIRADLKSYKSEVCQEIPQLRSAWKYINTEPEKKDKYLIELPASVRVPEDFMMKGKRGMNATINSDDPAYFRAYMTDNFVELQREGEFTKDELVQLSRNAFDVAWISDAERSAYHAEIDTFLQSH